MKKLLLFSIVVFSLFSFAALRPAADHPKATVSRSAFDLNDWLIDKATFDRMFDFYQSCKGKECKVFKKSKRNKAVREEIEKTYTILNEDQFMGRYTDADVPRYQKARGLGNGDERGKVKGFSTIITRYEVEPKDGFLQGLRRFLYSDEYSICPPPDSPPCN